MKKLEVMLVLVMVFGCVAQAGVVFVDDIGGYLESGLGTRYENQNPDVIKSQENGNGTGCRSSFDIWSLTAPDQFVINLSGVHSAYSTFATTGKSSSAQYGQALLRLARKNACFTRVGLFGDTNASFSNAAGATSNTVCDLIIDHGGNVTYGSGGGVTSLLSTDTDWHDITMNYDLVAGTYDIWWDSTKVVSGAALANPGYSSVQAFGVGTAYAGVGGRSALDQWQWLDSSTTPFTTAGTMVPEPATMVLLGFGAISLLRKRRK